MQKMSKVGDYHYAQDLATVAATTMPQIDRFTYTFENFFHPFVGDMITQLNLGSVATLLEPTFQAKAQAFFNSNYQLISSKAVKLVYFDKAFDVASGGPYANYNWEVLFHIPVMIAVTLSSQQRFAEAQAWFHYVFDPTSTDTSVAAPQRFWKFLAFRNEGTIESIDSLLILLSTPDDLIDPALLPYKQAVQTGYNAMLTNPFQPHVIARTRISAYQYYVVMKYLDNLIAWGDNLFTQDTIETLNEATLCYVLAANLLGPRPQALPQRGTITPKNFAQLKAAQLDPMSNAMVQLESQFPFNLTPGSGGQGTDQMTLLDRYLELAAVCIFVSLRIRLCWAIGISSQTGCSRFEIARISRASSSSYRYSTRRSTRACSSRPLRPDSISAVSLAASTSRLVRCVHYS